MTLSRFLRGILLVGLLSSLFSAVFGAAAGNGVVSTEDGFVDIDLPIVDTKKTTTGLVSVIARGEVSGSVVGFAVDINPSWKAKATDDGAVVFYWGYAQLRSTGEESDGFVRLLAEMYERPGLEISMPRRIEVEAVGLANDPAKVLTSPTKMKFFFNPDSEEEDYAEVFLNLDIPAKKLEFHEKDPEYREPLLRALGAGI